MTLDTSKPQNDSNKTSLRLEIMSRVVNFTEQLQTTAIKLEGASKIESEGTEILLTSESLEDTNTIEQPRKVAPVTRKASGFAPEFTRTFAPRSLTILRLKTAKASAAVRPIAQGTGR
jgi:alpha-N-arabinofuranosidase